MGSSCPDDRGIDRWRQASGRSWKRMPSREDWQAIDEGYADERDRAQGRDGERRDESRIKKAEIRVGADEEDGVPGACVSRCLYLKPNFAPGRVHAYLFRHPRTDCSLVGWGLFLMVLYLARWILQA